MTGLTRRGFLSFVGASTVGASALLATGCTQAETGSTQGSTAAAGSAAASGASTQTDALTVGLGVTSGATDARVASFYEHVRSVTALAKTYPAGEKVIGVALEYDDEIDASSIDAGNGGVGQQAAELGLGTYTVLGRTISTVYVNDEAALSADGGTSTGSWVIIELDPTDAGAQTLLFQMSRGLVGSNGPVSLDSATVKVCQLEDITTASGDTIAGDATSTRYLVASTTSNADAEGYVFGGYDDEATGQYASFALREPADYDASSSYPLVLFLPDAGVTSSDPAINLRQGPGAVAWNDDGCFVLTVAGACADIETCLDLIDALRDAGYAIDNKRLYGTGESAGCMALISYASEHPDDNRFAALMLVAGQGNMTPIANTPLFIMVSEDDSSSYGGMTSEENGLATIGIPYEDVQLDCTYDFDGEGHTSGRWYDYDAAGENNPSGNQEGAKEADSTRTLDELMANLEQAVSDAVTRADATDEHIVFCHIKEGTLDGTDSSISGGNTHNFTWQYAYNIEAARSWVLAQQL